MINTVRSQKEWIIVWVLNGVVQTFDSKSTTLNACKNILNITRVTDRPLWKHVLRALYLEWGNQNCGVPVPRALMSDCIFRSVKSSPQGGDKKDEKCWNRYRQEGLTCSHSYVTLAWILPTTSLNVCCARW